MEVCVDPSLERLRDALAAILRDRQQSPGEGGGYDAAWRLAALRDAVEREDVESGYALSPRSTRGATRA